MAPFSQKLEPPRKPGWFTDELNLSIHTLKTWMSNIALTDTPKTHTVKRPQDWHPEVHRLEKLNRYETHLDRKFERTLAMLLKLKDLQSQQR
jgi:hypothetical protein